MEFWKFLRIWTWPINGYARADNRCLLIIEDVLYIAYFNALLCIVLLWWVLAKYISYFSGPPQPYWEAP